MYLVNKLCEKIACCCKRARSEDNEEQSLVNERQTSWFSIYICTIFVLLDGIQYSMVIVSMWPYLKTIDPSATATFFGFIIAAFSLGQAISSPLLGYWSNKAKSIKPPLTLTLSMMMLANIIYGCIELFSTKDRSYIMMATRFIAGFAAGDVAVMRSYSATAAIKEERPKAIVISSAAWNLGMTLGPAVPVIFSPLGYPGWKISENLHLDMYTAPAWLSFINNIISMLVLHTIFKEEYVGVDENMPEELAHFSS
uniref:Major facilitator superfamily (MFS) profile domain-containing protein n=1 Tax=Acrobeloides nanus TaxID=290746 RepID=A0A914C8P6_9BILA